MFVAENLPSMYIAIPLEKAEASERRLSLLLLMCVFHLAMCSFSGMDGTRI